MTPEAWREAAPPRVLLVEDEVLIRIAVGEELRAAGVSVVEAIDAAEAWSYLQGGGAADLVFSDVQLPGTIDGLELARRVKRQFPNIDIVLTSGRSNPIAKEWRGRFLPKPYLFSYAVQFILGALAHHEANAPELLQAVLQIDQSSNSSK